jgi:hypothetical protein
MACARPGPLKNHTLARGLRGSTFLGGADRMCHPSTQAGLPDDCARPRADQALFISDLWIKCLPALRPSLARADVIRYSSVGSVLRGGVQATSRRISLRGNSAGSPPERWRGAQREASWTENARPVCGPANQGLFRSPPPQWKPHIPVSASQAFERRLTTGHSGLQRNFEVELDSPSTVSGGV